MWRQRLALKKGRQEFREHEKNEHRIVHLLQKYTTSPLAEADAEIARIATAVLQRWPANIPAFWS